MFAKTNVTLETCSRDLALTFAHMPALEGERAIKPARLAFLRAHLKAGTFVSPTWAVTVDKQTGIRYRANGQHSSLVLSEIPEPDYPANLLVTIEEYSSDDLAKDAFLIFDLFDHPASARGNLDVINLHKVHYKDLEGVTPKVLLNIANGIAFHEKGQEKGLFLPTRQRGGYFERPEYRQFAIWVMGFAKTLNHWMLKKPGIVAEMLVQRRTNPDAAQTFWHFVLTESHPDQDHETRELARTLKDWANKPAVSQEKIRKEAAKQWRRFTKPRTASLTMNYDQSETQMPSASA